MLSAAFVFLACSSARAASDGLGALHWSGDKTIYDTRNNRMDLIGHAAIHQGGESLYADKISFERDTKLVHAIGNAVYVGKTALIQGAEMHFNLETRTGTIVGGRVSTDQFTLSGERINKLGVNRFQAHNSDYSTCKDCPQSWTLSAQDVDLELDGYAYLTNVTVKIADAPGLWIPYLVVPIKTRRQTGLLIPRFGFTNEGPTFVQPLFWAISRSVDATLGFGTYGGRGRRIEGEARYALLRGQGQANFYHLNDRTFRDYLETNGFTNDKEGFSTSRWGFKVEQNQELPFGIQQKLRINDVSDSLYLSTVGDLPGNGEAYLTSDLSLSHATDKVSSFVLARRYRSILTPKAEDPRKLDPATVQIFPQAELTTNDKDYFGGRVMAGLSLGVTNFTRTADFFDRDPFGLAPAAGTPFRPGIDPIREAIRVKVNPSLYTTLRPADTISIVPRVNYRHYFYDFNGNTGSLSRGYLHFDTDVSTQFEKVYDLPMDPASDLVRVKHLVRPLINYSVIPYRHTPRHAFTDQMDYARENGFTGYNFDNEDIVPLDSTLNNANYFAPKGHSVSYGFTTQIARKRKISLINPGTPKATPVYGYDQPIEWSAGQSYNFREMDRSNRRPPDREPQPLSRIYSLMTAKFDKFSSYFDYYYIPYQPISSETSRHLVSLGAAWTPVRGTGRVLAYERSIAASYVFNRSNLQSQNQSVRVNAVFSLNDYIMPGFQIAYDMLRSRWQEANTTLTFQSPSECWKLDLGYFQTIAEKIRPEDTGWRGSFRFNLSLNLTGAGFGSVTDPGALAASTTPR